MRGRVVTKPQQPLRSNTKCHYAYICFLGLSILCLQPAANTRDGTSGSGLADGLRTVGMVTSVASTHNNPSSDSKLNHRHGALRTYFSGVMYRAARCCQCKSHRRRARQLQPFSDTSLDRLAASGLLRDEIVLVVSVHSSHAINASPGPCAAHSRQGPTRRESLTDCSRKFRICAPVRHCL
jgi:hypothetical protein